MKKYIIVFVVVFLLTYISIAFITWNIDISTWTQNGRFAITMFSGFIALVAFFHDLM